MPSERVDCVTPGCGKYTTPGLWPFCFDHSYEYYLRMKRIDPELHPFLTSPYAAAAVRRAVRLERERITAARDKQVRRNAPGWVYYLLIDDKIKIGYATDIRKRLRAYPPGCDLLAVEPGSLDVESQRHRQFEQHRVVGREWFAPCDDIREHVLKLIEQHGPPTRFAHRYRAERRPGPAVKRRR